MALDLIPASLREKYEVHEWKHACAILAMDFPEEWQDIVDLLNDFRFCQSWITSGAATRAGWPTPSTGS
ncbi:hypothetical protein DAETH_06240 [Deinococcus aetherius]|uniref:Uncharacterized protein n=1 Tax=Deinococcus aetherius TaxID=200252 RepID=A0ABN6RBE3_9DEIO|nr:hypothetical protein DAETH_06240 [Deinococcus aetherius]